MNKSFLWNAIIIFLMESYLEFGLASIAMLKRAEFDPAGDFNHKSNFVFGYLFASLLVGYPLLMATVYFLNRGRLDQKKVRNQIGQPFEGMRPRNKYQNLSIFFFYIVRRFFIFYALVIEESDSTLAILVFLASSEFMLIVLAHFQPYKSRYQVRMEVFNEVVITCLIMTLLCFTEVMDPEPQLVVGEFVIALLGLYLCTHLVGLAADSMRKFCLIVWRQLSKCRCGKKLQRKVRKRVAVVIKKIRVIQRRILRLPTLAEVEELAPREVLSESEPPSSEVATPNSSLSVGEIENIVNQIENSARPETLIRGAGRDGRTDAQMISNILVVSRRHKIEDAQDVEMNYWLAEIERIEQEDEQRRARLGLEPVPSILPQVIDLEQMEVNGAEETL